MISGVKLRRGCADTLRTGSPALGGPGRGGHEGVAGGAGVCAGRRDGRTAAPVWLCSLSPREALGFGPALTGRVRPQRWLPFPDAGDGPWLRQRGVCPSAHKPLSVPRVWRPRCRTQSSCENLALCASGVCPRCPESSTPPERFPSEGCHVWSITIQEVQLSLEFQTRNK